MVLASFYRGMRNLVTQIKENIPVFGHGPLWIVQLWFHAYFPQFGSKKVLIANSEEDLSCYGELLRLSSKQAFLLINF